MPAESHITFNDIVLNGLKMMTGMPPFGDALSQADATAIHAYIVEEAKDNPFPEPEGRPAPENVRFE
jgi:mono/diheme cytochrome c family protein